MHIMWPITTLLDQLVAERLLKPWYNNKNTIVEKIAQCIGKIGIVESKKLPIKNIFH